MIQNAATVLVARNESWESCGLHLHDATRSKGGPNRLQRVVAETLYRVAGSLEVSQ